MPFSEFWDFLVSLLNNPAIKLFSYVVSPILALISFVYARRDRRELRGTTSQLTLSAARYGSAKTEVRAKQELLDQARADLQKQQVELLEEQTNVQQLRAELQGITAGASELWKLRPAQPFHEYKAWLNRPKGARIVTFGNLKGGVGKTTLAANFAAYVSEELKKPVLIVDLDYQGSLTNMLMLASEKEVVSSLVDSLFDENADLSTLERSKVHLVPTLTQAWLTPASFSLAQLENRLLLRWLLNDAGPIDVRYRLAHLLLNPDLRESFAAIVIDTPPRMSLATINALVASHHFVVPTTLDALGVRAIPQFVANMQSIKRELDLDLELAGIVGMMSRQAVLSQRERGLWDDAGDGARAWSKDQDFRFATTIPRRSQISDSAGDSIAYLATPEIKTIFEPLFIDIARKIGL